MFTKNFNAWPWWLQLTTYGVGMVLVMWLSKTLFGPDPISLSTKTISLSVWQVSFVKGFLLGILCVGYVWAGVKFTKKFRHEKLAIAVGIIIMNFTLGPIILTTKLSLPNDTEASFMYGLFASLVLVGVPYVRRALKYSEKV